MQVKSGNKPSYGVGGKYIFVNFEYVSFSLMVGIPAKEWDYHPSCGLIFFQTSSQEVFFIESITDEVHKVF